MPLALLASASIPVPSPVSKGKDPKLLKYRNAPQIESEGDSGSLAMSLTMSLMKATFWTHDTTINYANIIHERLKYENQDLLVAIVQTYILVQKVDRSPDVGLDSFRSKVPSI